MGKPMRISRMLGNGYKLAVIALAVTLLAGCGGGGGGGGSGGGDPGTQPTNTPPSSPGSLTATPASASVTISWSSVSGATSYNLYWNTTGGVTTTNGTKVAGVSSPYTHSGLTNGTVYYYVLTAVNDNGESTASPQATATPVAPATGWSSGVRISAARDFFYYSAMWPGAVDINDAGVAVALWSEEGSEYWLHANVYQGGAWSTPAQIGDKGSLAPSVAVTAGGDAIAVYQQRIFDVSDIWIKTAIYSRRYDHIAGTWTAAEQISADSLTDDHAWEPSVAADSNGNAIAVWQHEGEVWSRRFNATLGAWEASPTPLSSSPRGVYTPKIVVDGADAFTAVWIQDSDAFDGGLPGGGPNHPTPYARRYVAGNWEASSQRIGWPGTDFLYGQFDGGGRFWVDANAAGDVFVVWEQGRTLADTSYQKSVDTARFDSGTGMWVGAATIAIHTDYLSWPQVAVDDSGNALAVWNRTETTGSSARGAWFNASAGTWGAPELIDETGIGDISDVVVGIDGSGNAEVAWYETGKGMIERRYDATGGTGWGPFNKHTPGSTRLILDMSDTGHAVLVGEYMDYGMTTWTRADWAWVLTP